MEAFAKNLRNRAQNLGLAHAEVARRVGLSERRYGHYITGRNEPDLAMLVRIADVLQTTPTDLLIDGSDRSTSDKELLLARLASVATLLSEQDLEVVITQTEAIVALRRKAQESP